MFTQYSGFQYKYKMFNNNLQVFITKYEILVYKSYFLNTNKLTVICRYLKKKIILIIF